MLPIIFNSSVLNSISYLSCMSLPVEFYQIIILVMVISAIWTFVAYFTRNGKNFRSSRNKKAGRQE